MEKLLLENGSWVLMSPKITQGAVKREQTVTQGLGCSPRLSSSHKTLICSHPWRNIDLGQGWVNYWPWTKIWPIAYFINKVLLRQPHLLVFVVVYDCFGIPYRYVCTCVLDTHVVDAYTGELSNCTRDHMAYKF